MNSLLLKMIVNRLRLLVRLASLLFVWIASFTMMHGFPRRRGTCLFHCKEAEFDIISKRFQQSENEDQAHYPEHINVTISGGIDKDTITYDAIKITEGDTKDDNKNFSNSTLGNDDLMSNVLTDVLSVEEGSTYEASLQNDISPRKQDDSEQFEKSDESQNKNMTLNKGKPIVDSNDEYQESVELENLENQFDEISSSSSNDVREHDIENINEKNDDENDKVTVHDDVTNINEGDEENNEENERSVVDTEDDNSAVSNITLGNDGLMSNVLADELNVEEGSTYEASLQNDISPRKQDDSEQFEKSDELQNKNMTLDKGKPIVDSNDEYQD